MKNFSLLAIILVIYTMTVNGQANFCNGPINISLPRCSSRIGYATQATGENAFASGNESKANYIGATAIGIRCESNVEAVSIGYECMSFKNSYSFGTRAIASGENCIAIGKNVESRMLNSITLGMNNGLTSQKLVNLNSNSIMMGVDVTIPTLTIISPEKPDYQNEVGKMGINTFEPVQELQVNGDLLISGSNSSLLFADETQPANAGYGKWGIEYETNGLNFWRPYEEKT